MTSISDELLEEFERKVGHRFTDRTLARTALTHSSAKGQLGVSNERLEFLGDAILGMVITTHLFHKLPGQDEGRLTRVKSVVVSSDTLAVVARDMALHRFLITGKGVATRRQIPKSILANTFEAVVAALYLDADFDAARDFVLERLAPHVEQVIRNQHERNYKSLLQQYIQKRYLVTPTYRVVSERGPDHGKSFEIVAHVGDQEYPAGWGHSKKQAEQKAAEEALRRIIGDELLGTEPDEEILRAAMARPSGTGEPKAEG
ncbi:MAG: ribonuclease III [Planctomycetes bacterium]|nr:ribonuclease III [Planctomycetota bacterium]